MMRSNHEADRRVDARAGAEPRSRRPGGSSKTSPSSGLPWRAMLRSRLKGDRRVDASAGAELLSRSALPSDRRGWRMPALLGAVILAVGVSACGASSASRIPSERVDEALRDEFPVEGRRWAFEAENEVIIALDRRDAARAALAAASDRVARAEAWEDVADRSGKAKAPVAALVAWRKEQRRQRVARLEEAEVEVYCARAAFELTKARLAVRFGLPVKARYLVPFEAQYEACAQEQAQASAAVQDAESRAGKALERWRDSRREYVSKTGDHDHGLWID